MTTRPRKMNISVMRNILQENEYDGERDFMINDDFGISYKASGFFRSVLGKNIGSPFIVEDYRVGYVIKGEISATINLIDTTIEAGNVVYIGRGSIGHVHSLSPDLTVRGFVISQNLVNKIFNNQKPDVMTGITTSNIFTADDADIQFLDEVNSMAWHLLRNEHYREDILHGLLASLLYYIDGRYKDEQQKESDNDTNSHSHDIFNRFISLVNQHAAQERALTFYADKMCLSPRYLGTIVAKHSGQTAKEWIDQATINHAKVMLIHTEKSISQIADALRFPNDSFFCKYFRRLTGESPTEYRKSR